MTSFKGCWANNVALGQEHNLILAPRGCLCRVGYEHVLFFSKALMWKGVGGQQFPGCVACKFLCPANSCTCTQSDREHLTTEMGGSSQKVSVWLVPSVSHSFLIKPSLNHKEADSWRDKITFSSLGEWLVTNLSPGVGVKGTENTGTRIRRGANRRNDIVTCLLLGDPPHKKCPGETYKDAETVHEWMPAEDPQPWGELPRAIDLPIIGEMHHMGLM